jgi:phosphoenolpyruvate carboxykinase (ATP)
VSDQGPVISRFGLDGCGLLRLGRAWWNLPAPVLIEMALKRGEGHLVKGGAFVSDTRPHTGRSPEDRFIVDEDLVREQVDWGEVNRPLAPVHFTRLQAKMQAFLQHREVFVQDVHAGADPRHRIRVRVVTCEAWHSLFARNMFRIPPAEELADFEPDVTVVQAPALHAEPEADGTRTGTFVAVGFGAGRVIIAGTNYAGEIKKSVFSVLNHLLPDQGVLPMHCSANVGEEGDAAIFFGLSGTGKTTLSSDPHRRLVGDDEHGWGERGIFNFEGGCYAKVIRLRREAEPEIYDASLRFGALLENVVFDPLTGEPDLDDDSYTENTRSSYPLDFIPGATDDGMAGHPRNVVMLTADAFGVLPPVSLLTPEQAMYHFLSGYTARLAGTEKGVTDPEATFSACFGAPFMPRHPSVYADMLRERIGRHGARCWLINTGWTGGAYGVGRRIPLEQTRAMLQAALDGRLAEVERREDPYFGLRVPVSCPDVDEAILDPESTWDDREAYRKQAHELARRFEDNFRGFEPHVDPEVTEAGIHAAA